MKNTRTYTITAIAKELKVTRQTIYYWIKKNWVMPKRDYRNYPVFSESDLRSIKKWYGALRQEVITAKPKCRAKPCAKTTPPSPPSRRDEIQKVFSHFFP